MTSPAPTLRITKIHRPVTALGPGRRVGLWLQGCHIGCRGCLSLDTWDPEAVPPMLVSEVVERLVATFETDRSLTGLTVSGGEPSEQASALGQLLGELRGRLADRTPAVDVLVYSGLSWGRLLKVAPGVVALVDAVIPEPFIAAKAPGGRWRGSSNQPLVLLTPLAEQRYSEAADPSGEASDFQVVVEAGAMWTIGVPRPGDLDRVLAIAAAHGVKVEKTSWRT